MIDLYCNHVVLIFLNIVVYFYHRDFKVSIPAKTRKNGTLYIHAFVYPRGQDPLKFRYTHDVSKITTYTVPQASVLNLLSDSISEVSLVTVF